MSDSGKQIGDCRHGNTAGRCSYCQAERVPELEAENARLRAELADQSLRLETAEGYLSSIRDVCQSLARLLDAFLGREQ